MEFQEQYDTLVGSDPAYEGRFIAGVWTTGIFCRPTCRALKTKLENIEFFPSTREALLAGYRPCKLCHPLETKEPVPALIQALLDDIEARPEVRIRDDVVRARGLDPDAVRRWFKKHHGLTFQGYQRSRRLGEAFGHIRQGQSVAAAPTKTLAQRLLLVTRIATPLGLMVAAEAEGRLALLEFADRRTVENELVDLERFLEARCLAGTSPLFDKLEDQLTRYFAGALKEFDLPLVLPGTPFQKAAWQALVSIPYGQSRTYGQQALALGQPAAIRAVGTANGCNRVAIVVPCHRVVAADGTLARYGGGLWRKRWLLDLEAGRLSPPGGPLWFSLPRR